MAADGARHRGETGGAPAGRAPGAGRRRAWTVAAVALIVGGVTAVAVGFATQVPSPPGPAAAATASDRSGSSDAPTTPVTKSPAHATGPTSVPAPTKSSPKKSTTHQVVKQEPLPTDISIPSVGISSSLLTMGLADDGTIAVAKPGPDYNKAGWFKGSPRPGADGPAVIEGHVDGVNGKSIFYTLGAVKKGAKVEVTRKDKSVVTFVVDKVESYPKDDFPVEDVYHNTKDPELRLITCGGAYDRSTGHYLNNTVVYAHEA